MYQNFLNLNSETVTLFPTGDTGIYVWETKSEKREILVSNYLKHI